MAYPASYGARDGAAPFKQGMAVDYQLVDNRFILLGLLTLFGYFILFVIALFIPDLRPGFYTLSGLSFLAYAAVRFYLDTKRTAIEFNRSSIIIRRPLFGPLVFDKSSIRSIETKKTYLPIPRWAFAVLSLLSVAVIFFSMIQVNVMRWMNGYAVNPDFAFGLFFAAGFAVVMLELSYRSFAMLSYPGFLKVKLNTDGTLRLYSKDPDGLAAMLGAP
jgi:hydrogenase-4 membrane subunit HyfE